MNDIDFDLAARLNLYEKLFVQALGACYADMPDGEVALLRFRNECLDFLGTVRTPFTMTNEQRAEWRLHCDVVTGQLFDRVERQRAFLLRVPPRPG